MRPFLVVAAVVPAAVAEGQNAERGRAPKNRRPHVAAATDLRLTADGVCLAERLALRPGVAQVGRGQRDLRAAATGLGKAAHEVACGTLAPVGTGGSHT